MKNVEFTQQEMRGKCWERVKCLIERRNDWKSEMSLKDKKKIQQIVAQA